MSIEAMKQALEALDGLSEPYDVLKAQDALRTAIAEAEKQEPVAWVPMEQSYMGGQTIDILMGDGSILCNVLPQFDGDLWWEGSGTGEKFIDPKYANVTHWRIHSDTTPPAAQRQPLIDSVRQMRDVQGVDGTWNCDPYMHGLYNGLEFAVSLLEQREPQFRDAPEKWLNDLPKPRIFSATEAAHNIGGKA